MASGDVMTFSACIMLILLYRGSAAEADRKFKKSISQTDTEVSYELSRVSKLWRLVGWFQTAKEGWGWFVERRKNKRERACRHV